MTAENLVLAIDLHGSGGAPFVSNYVKAGVNAPAGTANDAFTFPDNLALDPAGNLYIAEDPGGLAATGKTIGDDIWVATPDRGSSGVAATA